MAPNRIPSVLTPEAECPKWHSANAPITQSVRCAIFPALRAWGDKAESRCVEADSLTGQPGAHEATSASKAEAAPDQLGDSLRQGGEHPSDDRWLGRRCTHPLALLTGWCKKAPGWGLFVFVFVFVFQFLASNSVGVAAVYEGAEQPYLVRRNVALVDPNRSWPAILSNRIDAGRSIASNFDNESCLMGLVIEPHPVINRPNNLGIDCFDCLGGPLNVFLAHTYRYGLLDFVARKDSVTEWGRRTGFKVRNVFLQLVSRIEDFGVGCGWNRENESGVNKCICGGGVPDICENKFEGEVSAIFVINNRSPNLYLNFYPRSISRNQSALCGFGGNFGGLGGIRRNNFRPGQKPQLIKTAESENASEDHKKEIEYSGRVRKPSVEKSYFIFLWCAGLLTFLFCYLIARHDGLLR